MDVLRIFGGRGAYLCVGVAKRLCSNCASALLFFCGFASCLQSIFLEEHVCRTASKRR